MKRDGPSIDETPGNDSPSNETRSNEAPSTSAKKGVAVLENINEEKDGDKNM